MKAFTSMSMTKFPWDKWQVSIEWNFAYSGPLYCWWVITFVVLSTAACWSIVFSKKLKATSRTLLKIYDQMKGSWQIRGLTNIFKPWLQPLLTKWWWNARSKIQMEGLLMPWAEAMFLFSDLKVLLSAFKRGFKILTTAKYPEYRLFSS